MYVYIVGTHIHVYHTVTCLFFPVSCIMSILPYTPYYMEYVMIYLTISLWGAFRLYLFFKTT